MMTGAEDSTVADCLLREQLKLYEAERWRVDHDAAMHCLDVENAISFGVYLFERISRADEFWQLQVFNGAALQSEEIDKGTAELYQLWAGNSDRYLTELDRLEKQGFEVVGADEFRRCCKEVRGIITDDVKFFSGDKFVELKDLAIDAHRHNETSPM